MKVIFAKHVIDKLKFHIRINKNRSGYLRIKRVGKNLIVTDIISSEIKKIFDKGVLSAVYELWGSEFGGVYFNEMSCEIPVFLFEKLILHIGESKYTFFTFDSDSKSLKKVQDGRI